MDIAVETISGFATAPGTAGANATAVTGDSFQVRDAKGARLISIWGNRHVDGFFRLTSPLLHDAVVGIQTNIHTTDVTEYIFSCPQMLTPQDTLVAFITGSATAGDIEHNSYTIMYENLAGICGKFIDFDTLKAQAAELYSTRNVITLATDGNFSVAELLNSEQDQLKANMDYAIIGVTKVGDSSVSSYGFTSPDWGNLRVATPAYDDEPTLSSDYFTRLAIRMGMPLIPVFNASQKTSVFVDALADEDGGTATFITNMVRLKPGTVFGMKGKK